MPVTTQYSELCEIADLLSSYRLGVVSPPGQNIDDSKRKILLSVS